MSNFLDYIVYGTFGSPHGFQQSILTNRNLETELSTFDLRGAIEITPGSTMFSIRKQNVSGVNIISYTKNSFANEPGSKRRGSFIGAGILLLNGLAEENTVLDSLNEFHLNLINNNVINDSITVSHSNKLIGLQHPASIQKVLNSRRELPDILSFRQTEKKLVIYCKVNPSILKKSIDLLNEYDTIYFTDSQKIAQNVQSKGLIPIIDQNGFENEIQRVEAERLRKVQSTIDDFQRKINEVNTDKVRFSENHQSELQRLKKIHQENQEKINLFEKSKSFYEESYANFAQYIGNLINNLKLDGKIDVAQQNLRNASKIFNDAIARNKTPDFNAIHTAQIRSNIKEPVNHQSIHGFNDPFNFPEQEDSPKKGLFSLDLYKVISIVLAALLLGSWLYFYFSGDSEEVNSQKIEEKHPEPVTNYQEDEQTTETHKQVSMTLSPKPTTQLNHNDLNIVNRKLTKEMMLDEVVALIFKENPTDISQWYQNQAESYGIELSKLNRNSFEEREGIYYYTGDSLIEIPSHQEQVP